MSLRMNIQRSPRFFKHVARKCRTCAIELANPPVSASPFEGLYETQNIAIPPRSNFYVSHMKREKFILLNECKIFIHTTTFLSFYLFALVVLLQ